MLAAVATMAAMEAKALPTLMVLPSYSMSKCCPDYGEPNSLSKLLLLSVLRIKKANLSVCDPVNQLV